MTARVEWQVWSPLEADRREVHIFRTKKAAERYAAKCHEFECHEGGIWVEKKRSILRVVRHKT